MMRPRLDYETTRNEHGVTLEVDLDGLSLGSIKRTRDLRGFRFEPVFGAPSAEYSSSQQCWDALVAAFEEAWQWDE